MAGFIRELWKEYQPMILWQLSERKQGKVRSITLIPSGATIRSNGSANTLPSITQNKWSINAQRIILMGLRVSGVLLNIFCTIIGAFPNIIFRCILKKWSIGLTTAKRIFSSYFYQSILVTFRTNYLKI